MIKIMNHHLNTTTQQTQDSHNKDYRKCRSENDIFKTATQNDIKVLQHFNKNFN